MADPISAEREAATRIAASVHNLIRAECLLTATETMYQMLFTSSQWEAKKGPLVKLRDDAKDQLVNAIETFGGRLALAVLNKSLAVLDKSQRVNLKPSATPRIDPSIVADALDAEDVCPAPKRRTP